jgi:E3 ubiquitin-protein ligase SH3RF
VEAIYPYTQQKADELELVKGDLYRVIEACKDHWFRGTHLKTGRVGVFPGNYVRPLR